MIQSNVFVGVKPPLNNTTYSHDSLETIDENTFDYLLLPITNTKYRNTVKKYYMDFQDPIHMLRVPAPQLQEINISPKTNSSKVTKIITEPEADGSALVQGNSNNRTGPVHYIGLASSWIELESNDVAIRELSFQVLKHEWDYANFIGIKKIILAPPRNLQNLNEYGSMINRLLNSIDSAIDDNDYPLLSISLPIFEDSNPLSTWELWNNIRTLVDYHPNFTISLALPKYKTPSYVIEKWQNEPVSCLLLSSSIFSPNRFNFPVLNKYNQEIIYQFQKYNGNQQLLQKDLIIILHGLEKYSKIIKNNNLEQSYLDYTNFILDKGDKKQLKRNENWFSNFSMNNKEDLKMLTNFGKSQILSFLKPINGNLPNSVYHFFEKDSTKYEQYGNAIFAALQDLRHLVSCGRGEEEKTNPATRSLNILVAGAGRGPLVSKVFNALQKLGFQKKQYKIYAIEKNQQAVLYLQKRNSRDWNNEVDIIQDDVRNLPIPMEDRDEDKFDLIVSELLGSFGCNELSPEILQFLDLYFSKNSTIFIPWKYTSYLAPVSTSSFHQNLNLKDSGKNFEKPWILHNTPYSIVSSKINELWSFTHNTDSSSKNEGDNALEEDGYSLTFLSRSVTSKFKIKYKSEIHGLLGFFSANLYKKSIILSIVPDNKPIRFLSSIQKVESRIFQKTKDLKSWSPMIFPFKQPLYVSDDTELEVFFTRNNNGHKAWYEWCAQSFMYLETDVQSPVAGNTTPVENLQKLPTEFDTTQESKLHTSMLRKATNERLISTLSKGEQHKYTDNGVVQQTAPMTLEESAWQSVHDIHNLLINGDSTKRDSMMMNSADATKRNSYLNEEVTKILSKPMFDLKLDTSNENVSNGKNITGALKVKNPLVSQPEEFKKQINDIAEDKKINYHIRIKTNGITLHNVNGRHFSTSTGF